MAKNKIKFIRHYFKYGQDIYDVVYKTRRLCTYYGEKELPKTVLSYMAQAETREQHDEYDGDETIYEMKESKTFHIVSRVKVDTIGEIVHTHEQTFSADCNVFGRVLEYRQYMAKTFPDCEYKLIAANERTV